MLAPKDILLFGGWDDPNVSVENIILPLYRALISEHAAPVTIIAVQDNHTFKDTRTELPQEWKNQAFEKKENDYLIRNEFRQDVQFLQQDIRSGLPEGTFDLILCRNQVFTYFQEDIQRQVFQRIMTRLDPGGYLIIGNHESLPEGQEDLVPVERCVYKQRDQFTGIV